MCHHHRHSSYFVTALLHIEILEPNSKLASKLCRAYKRNAKNDGTYFPFGKEFTIEMENHTYQQKQGTNVHGFCVMDSMFHFHNKNTYEEQRIEVTY
jgi:hypothetical protein